MNLKKELNKHAASICFGSVLGMLVIVAIDLMDHQTFTKFTTFFMLLTVLTIYILSYLTGRRK